MSKYSKPLKTIVIIRKTMKNTIKTRLKQQLKTIAKI